MKGWCFKSKSNNVNFMLYLTFGCEINSRIVVKNENPFLFLIFYLTGSGKKTVFSRVVIEFKIFQTTGISWLTSFSSSPWAADLMFNLNYKCLMIVLYISKLSSTSHCNTLLKLARSQSRWLVGVLLQLCS